VSEPEPLLGREGIEEAFRRLGDRLAKRGVVADIYVFGGAAMALAYDSRRATRDVDALFKPHGIVHEEARAVGAELGLPSWWLNEQASSYVAPGGDPSPSRVFDHPGLRVFAASPEHLLAMKALAARRARHQVARDRVKRNVALLCDVPQGPGGRPSKSLTFDQADALLAAAESRSLHAYIVVSLLTGARTEERSCAPSHGRTSSLSRRSPAWSATPGRPLPRSSTASRSVP
jgi:hypothetical protein